MSDKTLTMDQIVNNNNITKKLKSIAHDISCMAYDIYAEDYEFSGICGYMGEGEIECIINITDTTIVFQIINYDDDCTRERYELPLDLFIVDSDNLEESLRTAIRNEHDAYDAKCLKEKQDNNEKIEAEEYKEYLRLKSKFEK